MRSKSKLQRAHSATASFLSCSLLLAVGGCTAPSGPVLAKDDGSKPKGTAMTQGDVPPLPEKLGASNLYIFSGGGKISYGDPVVLATNDGGFKRPDKSSSVNRVPGGLGGTYQCYGWETPTRAFGVLSRKEKVVLALDTYEEADQQALDDLRTVFVKQFGSPVSVDGTHVHYQFWNDGEARLMLCSTVNDLGSLSFSVALGNADLMTYFRMDPASAKDDQTEADRLFAERQQSSR